MRRIRMLIKKANEQTSERLNDGVFDDRDTLASFGSPDR